MPQRPTPPPHPPAATADRAPAAGASPGGAPPNAGRGVAVGLAIVLLAVVTGVLVDHAGGRGSGAGTRADVPATGLTTTVEVVADGMRFHPDQIEVPAGNRLVITLVNQDRRRHDLVLASGAKSAIVAGGGRTTLDAGIIGATVEGWCSLPGHRQAGMRLTITATGAPPPAAAPPEASAAEQPTAIDHLADPGAGFSARDATAPLAGAGGQVHRHDLRVQEVVREVAPGVRQRLWTFGGTTPGPVLRGQVGDTFEITLINDGSLDHGIDFHASALAPDRPMRPIDPGQRLTYRFTAARAGVWMYHCSTEPMLHHVGNGMYGVVIIDPPDLPPAGREYVLVQSELYLGPDGAPGDLDRMRTERPDAVVFNGYAAQYAHRPLPARPGERVRIWLLNAGPNRPSAFHIVGAQFDTLYQEGLWLLRPDDPGGAQVLDLAPASGGFVETVFPEPGDYPFLDHTLVNAERGARGVFRVR